MTVRGKPVIYRRHALDGMNAERPSVSEHDVEKVLEDPDQDDGSKAVGRIGKRTIIVYYDESKEDIHVRGVSATSRRLAP